MVCLRRICSSQSNTFIRGTHSLMEPGLTPKNEVMKPKPGTMCLFSVRPEINGGSVGVLYGESSVRNLLTVYHQLHLVSTLNPRCAMRRLRIVVGRKFCIVSVINVERFLPERFLRGNTPHDSSFNQTMTPSRFILKFCPGSVRTYCVVRAASLARTVELISLVREQKQCC